MMLERSQEQTYRVLGAVEEFPSHCEWDRSP